MKEQKKYDSVVKLKELLDMEYTLNQIADKPDFDVKTAYWLGRLIDLIQSRRKELIQFQQKLIQKHAKDEKGEPIDTKDMDEEQRKKANEEFKEVFEAEEKISIAFTMNQFLDRKLSPIHWYQLKPLISDFDVYGKKHNVHPKQSMKMTLMDINFVAQTMDKLLTSQKLSDLVSYRIANDFKRFQDWVKKLNDVNQELVKEFSVIEVVKDKKTDKAVLDADGKPKTKTYIPPQKQEDMNKAFDEKCTSIVVDDLHYMWFTLSELEKVELTPKDMFGLKTFIVDFDESDDLEMEPDAQMKVVEENEDVEDQK